MVPAMDMFTKSSPVLSQTSEQEADGRQRQREGEMGEETEEKSGQGCTTKFVVLTPVKRKEYGQSSGATAA